ncbi:acyl carrier protein [bacterium]|nr:acyl carrier protein [bacterium]
MKDILKQFIEQELLLSDGSNVSINEDDNLLADGKVDSLGIMRLVAFIEEQFGINIPYEDVTIENFQTIMAIVDYLEKRGKERVSS